MTDPEREIWDCPHTLTLQMMYQSLDMLYKDQEFDCFHSFFLYPVEMSPASWPKDTKGLA